MKFDYIIGNPPYNEETAQKKSETNGQAPSKNIFQCLQMEADKIASKSVELIYPGGRWMHQSGKGMAKFGKDQINDPHLQEIIFYANANEVFPGIEVPDGISIVIKNMGKNDPGFKYNFIQGSTQIETKMDNPGKELIPLDPRDSSLLNKINTFVESYKLDYLHDNILPRSLFNIESDFVSKNPESVRPFSDDSTLNYTNEVKLLTNDKAGKAGRSKWFIAPRSVIKTNVDKIGEWQVVVSSASPGGQKRDRQLEIIDNHSAFGRVRVALRSFKTQQEAENFYKYVSSYVIRYAFLMTDEALTSLGKRVPDILDYSPSNKIINFNKDVDKQLYEILSLTDEEISYIKDCVDKVREA